MRNILVVFLFIAFSPFCRADFALHMYHGDSFRTGAAKTSTADNASAVFNNPAALTELPKHSVLVEGHYFDIGVNFRDAGSFDAIGSPLSGGNGGDGGVSQLVPGFYYSNTLDSHWSYGVALNVPFGLSVKWPDNWIGRYHITESGIETININPVLAYKISEHVSVGAGLSAQYAKARLSNAIDFGAVCFALVDPTTCSGLGLTPQAVDGKVLVKGDDWGYAYNIGLFITSDKTNFGISYRSKIDYTLQGTADFTTPSAAAALFSPAFTDTNVSVPITLPEVFAIGVTHTLTDKLRISADATWTRWSRIKSFDFSFENPAQPALSIARNWKDTWRYAIGAEYRKNKTWTFQGGIAYADSAIPEETFDPAIPISNAWWFSAGVLYTLNEEFTIGAGINHIKFVDRIMDKQSPYGDTVKGTISPNLNVYSVQLRWNY